MTIQHSYDSFFSSLLPSSLLPILIERAHSSEKILEHSESHFSDGARAAPYFTLLVGYLLSFSARALLLPSIFLF